MTRTRTEWQDVLANGRPDQTMVALMALTNPEHSKDADCAIDPANDCCRICGVWHGDPCPECGGRGYHAPKCCESD